MMFTEMAMELWRKLSPRTRFLIIALVGLSLVAGVYVTASAIMIRNLKQEIKKQEKAVDQLEKSLRFQKRTHEHQITVLKSEKKALQIKLRLARLEKARKKTAQERQKVQKEQEQLEKQGQQVNKSIEQAKKQHKADRAKVKDLTPEEHLQKLREYYKKWKKQ